MSACKASLDLDYEDNANGSNRLTPPWKRRVEIIRCEIGITNVSTKLIKPPLPAQPPSGFCS